MKIRNFLTLVAVSIVTRLTDGCQEKPEDGGSSLDGKSLNLEFTVVEASEIGYNSAVIRVKHNGTSADTWYGFVTEQVGAKESTLIRNEIERITEDGKVTAQLSKGNSIRVDLVNLKSAKKYKYIVFAITEDGIMYGTARSVEFTTTETMAIMEKVNNWSVTYNGRDEKNQELFAFDNSDNSMLYITFINAINIEIMESTDEFQTYGGMRLLDENENLVALLTAEEALVYMTIIDEVNYYLQNGYSVSELTVNESMVASSERKQSGEYLAVCIQCDANGPTGYYSCDKITILPEDSTPEYERWLGTWTFTSSNDVTYTIELSEEDPNFLYAAKGWECGEELGEKDFGIHNIYIPMFYDKLTQKFIIKSYDNSSDAVLWGLYGWYHNASVNALVPFIDDAKICEAKYSDTEPIMLNGVQLSTGNDVYAGLRYTSYLQVEEGLKFGSWNPIAEFPIEMTKQAAPVASSNIRVSTAGLQMFNVENGIKIGQKAVVKNIGTPYFICKGKL